MSTEERYERGWAKCPECGTLRPDRALGPDGKCADDWHARMMQIATGARL